MVNESGTAREGELSPAPTILDAFDIATVQLPNDLSATDAQFLRQGDDLLLISPDGGVFVLQGYFLNDAPPSLTTPLGGRLSPELVASFTPPETVGQYAQAGGAPAEDAIGHVQNFSGNVFVVRTDGTRVLLSAGDPIFQGDVVETAAGAAINLMFVDKTTFALGADARLAIDELVFNPDTGAGNSSFAILKGIFVFSSGEIAKFNYENMVVKTPIATIGIRGTKVAGDVKSPGEVSTFTVIEGQIVVRTDSGFVLMNEANETTYVTAFSAAPSESVILSDAQLDKIYSEVKDVSNGYFDGVEGRDESSSKGGEGEGENPGERSRSKSSDNPGGENKNESGASGEAGEGDGKGDAEEVAPQKSGKSPDTEEEREEGGFKFVLDESPASEDGVATQENEEEGDLAPASGPGELDNPDEGFDEAGDFVKVASETGAPGAFDRDDDFFDNSNNNDDAGTDDSGANGPLSEEPADERQSTFEENGGETSAPPSSFGNTLSAGSDQSVLSGGGQGMTPIYSIPQSRRQRTYFR
jgi:hypothetical protein